MKCLICGKENTTAFGQPDAICNDCRSLQKKEVEHRRKYSVGVLLFSGGPLVYAIGMYFRLNDTVVTLAALATTFCGGWLVDKSGFDLAGKRIEAKPSRFSYDSLFWALLISVLVVMWLWKYFNSRMPFL